MINFSCLCNGHKGQLSFNEKLIFITIDNKVTSLDISLNLHVKWEFKKRQLTKCLLEQYEIVAQPHYLEQLKHFLSGRVMFLGIMGQYEEITILQETELKKICVVKSTLNYQEYICKVWKKTNLNKYQVFNEILILKKMSKHKNMVRLIEVYESSNHYYLILEKLVTKLENDYTHEEIQLIIKEILEMLECLHSMNMIHGNIKPNSIMLDKHNQLKLIGFSKAKEITNQQEHDLSRLHHILLYLYNIDEGTIDIDLGVFPNIPDHGTNFLKGLINNTQYRFNITQALSHPFITATEQDHQIVKKEMHPKFKSIIE